MKQFIDQTGRCVALAVFPPRRIVSLVPSQTELLYELGLRGEVVGITKFCTHPPEWFQEKKRVGGTKTVDPEKVWALQPDLVIGNKEENERRQLETLAERVPVWVSDVRTLAGALDMIGQIGALAGKPDAASACVETIREAFARCAPAPGHTRPRVAYFIWRKPYMVAAGDTFVDAMLREAGFDNVFSRLSRYPEITLDTLAAAAPALILLSSEPFPFQEKHFGAFHEACPGAAIRVVDGALFSWYGSRLRDAPAYFRELRETALLAGS